MNSEIQNLSLAGCVAEVLAHIQIDVFGSDLTAFTAVIPEQWVYRAEVFLGGSCHIYGWRLPTTVAELDATKGDWPMCKAYGPTFVMAMGRFAVACLRAEKEIKDHARPDPAQPES